MKKGKLLKRIERIAREHKLEFEFERHGSRHDHWRFDGMFLAIPRHSDIPEALATSIIKDCQNRAERQK